MAQMWSMEEEWKYFTRGNGRRYAGMSFDDVKVICRQLGFEEALAEFIGSDVRDEGIPYAMSDVSCTGEESELASCDRIDGKLNIPSQCQSNDKGSQVLCQPSKQLNF